MREFGILKKIYKKQTNKKRNWLPSLSFLTKRRCDQRQRQIKPPDPGFIWVITGVFLSLWLENWTWKLHVLLLLVLHLNDACDICRSVRTGGRICNDSVSQCSTLTFNEAMIKCHCCWRHRFTTATQRWRAVQKLVVCHFSPVINFLVMSS